MYNSEFDFIDELDLGTTGFDDPDGSAETEFFGELELADDDLDELFAEQEDFFDTDEFSDLDDDDSLSKIANEINRDVFAMNDSEAENYIENRMSEFFPALMKVIPSIVSLAPKAISAVKSIVSKDTPKAVSPPVTPPVTVAPVVPTAPLQPVVTPGNNVQVAQTPTAPLNMNDPAVMQMFRVFMDLIQSPQVLQLLSGLGTPPDGANVKTADGTNVKTTNTTTPPTNDQAVNGSNVLGVIASLAGALSGPPPSEFAFPEYVISNDGTFRIDPHNVVQEAELILDIIN